MDNHCAVSHGDPLTSALGKVYTHEDLVSPPSNRQVIAPAYLQPLRTGVRTIPQIFLLEHLMHSDSRLLLNQCLGDNIINTALSRLASDDIDILDSLCLKATPASRPSKIQLTT